MDEIETRLREALWVFARMPAVGHKPYRPAWPEMLRDWTSWDRSTRVTQAKPDTAAITRAEEAMTWLSYIPREDDTIRLVSAYCLGKSMRSLADNPWQLGRCRYKRKYSRTSLRQYYQKGLRAIQRRVENGNI